MTTLTEQIYELAVLMEAAIPSYLKRWLKVRLGVTSVKRGTGSMARYVVVGGRFDEQTQDALRFMGFTVTGVGMAYIGSETAAWHDLLKWAQMDRSVQ